MIEFKDAKPDQGILLRDILIESKGHWGYSQFQLEQWRANLTFTESYIAGNTVKLILESGAVVGFFAITRQTIDELDHFWLIPHAIRNGIGGIAFNQIISECRRMGIQHFEITSDPDAEGFYLKQGAKRFGEVYSQPQRRMLPTLKFAVPE